MRLTFRIWLGYFLVLGLTAAFVLKTVLDEIKPSVRQTIEEVMVDTANLLAELAVQDMRAGNINSANFASAVTSYANRDIKAKIWHFDKETLDFDIYVTDRAGVVVFDSQNRSVGKDFSMWRNVQRTLRGEYGARSSRENQYDDSTSVFHVSAPINSAGSDSMLLGTLTVAKSMETVQPIIERAQQTIIKQALILLGVALIIGALLANQLNRSINKLVRFADQTADGEVAVRPDLRTKELDQLAVAMEKMRTELSGKQYLEQYAQALAHELKSPLSAIAASAEFLANPDLEPDKRAQFAQLVTSQSERMTLLINTLLAAARTESIHTLTNLPSIDLPGLCSQALSKAQALAIARGVVLSLAAQRTEAANIQADPYLLELAISNLLTNAIEHSARGESVHLSFEVQAQQAIIVVIDSGTGIPDYALSKVFDRFYSLAHADGKKGSGLGLSMVTQIAKLHGGTIGIKNRKDPITAQTCGCIATLSIASSHNLHSTGSATS
jgi:two-component system, OmpR family, sensor histidine kinase CreC